MIVKIAYSKDNVQYINSYGGVVQNKNYAYKYFNNVEEAALLRYYGYDSYNQIQAYHFMIGDIFYRKFVDSNHGVTCTMWAEEIED